MYKIGINSCRIHKEMKISLTIFPHFVYPEWKEACALK